MRLTIHFDGGSRGNPGPASAGVVLVDADSGKPVHEAGYYLGKCTNNVAEYQGLLRSLDAAKQLGADDLNIHSDSQLLVRQILGEYRVKSPDLKPLYQQAVTKLRGFANWRIEHVRRDKNQRADELANLAMDHRADVTPGNTGKPSAGPSQPAPDTPTLPCWSAKLSGKNGTCLAGCGTGNEYTFGPTTPDGFCIHAASAILNNGPIQWPANKRSGTTACQACGLKIQMRVIR